VGIRQTLNKRPLLTAGATLLATALVVALVLWRGLGHSAGGGGGAQVQGWFTTDDGATWFVDDISRLPPYQTADGRTAVKVHLYRCGPGCGKDEVFVAFLERLTPQARQALAGQPAQGKNPYAGMTALYGGSAVEVKLPGKGAWVAINAQEAAKIVTPRCPHGHGGEPEAVLP
jgi:hypothetical protein